MLNYLQSKLTKESTYGFHFSYVFSFSLPLFIFSNIFLILMLFHQDMYTALVKNYNSPFLLYSGHTELSMGNVRLISNWHDQTDSSIPHITG